MTVLFALPATLLLALTSVDALNIPKHAGAEVASRNLTFEEVAAMGRKDLQKRQVWSWSWGSGTNSGSSTGPAAGSYFQGWQSAGCWSDNWYGADVLPNSFISTTMSYESCFAWCYNNGGNYAGVENGNKCMCGSTYDVSRGAYWYGGDYTMCNMACTGSPSENCGGSNSFVGWINAGGYQSFITSSQTLAASLSRSASASLSASASQSQAVAASASQASGASRSISQSQSQSASAALSASAASSLSAFQSASNAQAASVSRSQSASASLAMSQSMSQSAWASQSASAANSLLNYNNYLASIQQSQSVAQSIANSMAASQTAASIAASQVVSASVAASQIASQAASQSASSIAASQSASASALNAYLQSIAASQQVSASVAASRVVSASVAASQVISASVAASQVASQSAYNAYLQSIAASQVVSGSIAASQVISASVAASQVASQSAYNAYLQSIAASQVVSGSIAASQVISASVAASQVASQSAYNAYLQSIAASQVVSGSIAASQVVSASVAASQVASQSAYNAYIQSLGASQSQSASAANALAQSIAASQVVSASVAASQVASQSAYNAYIQSLGASQSQSASAANAYAQSIAASQVISASVAASQVASQSIRNAIGASQSASASAANAYAQSIAASQVASASVANAYAASISQSASAANAYAASIGASQSQSASAANAYAAGIAASQSQSASAANAYVQSIAASQSASASRANAYAQSIAASQVASASVAQSISAAGAYAQSIAASQSASASAAGAYAQSIAASQVASASVAQSISAAGAYAQSIAASQSASASAAGAYAQSIAASQVASASVAQSISAAGAYAQSIAASQSASVSAAGAYAQSIAASQVASAQVAQSISAAGAYAQSIAASQSASASAAGAYVASIAASQSASASAAAATAQAALAQASSLPSGWVAAPTPYIAEGQSGRALTGASTSDSAMTWAKCINFCSSKNFVLAGLEYATQCYCGNVLSNGATLQQASTNGPMPCGGASAVNCGGPGALNLFVLSSAASAFSSDWTTTKVSLPSGWSIASTPAIAEGSSGRALTGPNTSASNMTIQSCLAFCQGYTYAGLEYASQCYCGNSFSNGASLSLPSSQCNMQCSGDATNICGGPNCLSLYVNSSPVNTTTATGGATGAASNVTLPSGWVVASTPAVAEGSSGRALTGASTSSSSMTIAMCLNFCGQKGFPYAGIEYSSECYCGNSFSNGASLNVSSTQCTMPCAGDSTSICGGPGCLNVYYNANNVGSSTTTTVSKVTLPSGWSVGSAPCIQEVAGRALTGGSTITDSMTPLLCINYCISNGFAMAGIEYGRECYCGNSLVNGASVSLTSNACTMPCQSDQTQTCGGPSALQYYVGSVSNSTTSTTASGPSLSSNPSTISGFAASNCIQEVAGRALNADRLVANTMTLNTCIGYCSGKGYSMAGVEYGQECYCGNSLVNGASTSLVSGQCNMPCAGNSTQICGGPNAIVLYVGQAATGGPTTPSTVGGYSSGGCVQEVAGRALTGARTTSSNMTLDFCVNYCSSNGFKYSGVEYGQECYCGSTFVNGGSLSLTSGQCNMPCPGNAAQICGGPNALTIFSGTPSASSSSSSNTGSTSGSTSSTSSSGPSIQSSSNGFSSQGCIQEVAGRALTGTSTTSSNMTIDFCVNYCSAAGFKYAGVEYGQECYCGNSLVNGASTTLTSSQCTMACPGSAGSLCGGPNALQLYSGTPSGSSSTTSSGSSNSNSSTTSGSSSTGSNSTTTTTTQTYGTNPANANGMVPKGCIQEVAGRALRGTSVANSTMSIETCTSFCKTAGYSMAGVEYGQECYCDNTLQGGASTTLVSGQCNMPCAGSPTEVCGGPNAIQLYSTN